MTNDNATSGDILDWVGDNIGNHDVLSINEEDSDWPCYQCVAYTNTRKAVYFEYDDTGYRGINHELTGPLSRFDLDMGVCEECGRESSQPVCYECQCDMHAAGEIDMDASLGW